MKHLGIVFLLIFILTSCGRPEPEVDTGTGVVEKQDFFVDISELGDFSSSYNLKKVGKLSSTQSVKLSSNASGRVSTIYVKEGETVKTGKLLASLSDNIANYNINVEKAQNAVSRAKINYDAQKISLDKQIADAELALGKLGKNLVNLQKTNAQNIARSEITIDNINATENIAKIDLNVQKLEQNIEKLEQNIEKLKFDALNQEAGNNETLSGFRSRILTEQNSLRLSLDDIIEFADEILGLTEENKDENEKFDQYLGAKDKVQRGVSEQSLRDLIKFRNGEFEDFVPDDISQMTDEQIISAIGTGEKGYSLTKTLLAELEKTFQNSIPSIGSLSNQDIDTYIAQINGFQSSTQGSYTGFISLKTQIESFVNTYENTEASTQKQIELLEKDKEILEKDKEILLSDRALQVKNLANAESNSQIGLESTKTQGDDAIVNLENQIASTQLSLDNAKKNRVVSLQSLNNQIAEANINYSQAIREREKLAIYAPISGTISSVNIDLGQEVNNGAELFTIENKTNTEIIIGLTDDEIETVKTGQKVSVDIDGERVSGKIFSISTIADANLNFKTTVELDKPIDKLGKIVQVFIPIQSKNTLVPLNIIDINNSGTQGTLSTLTADNEFGELLVQVGKTFEDKIEILKCSDGLVTGTEEEDDEDGGFAPCEIFEKMQIVTSNLNNYDAAKFKIVLK